MVKGALIKKSIQDMKKNRSQFLSIFIMAALAIGISVGLDTIWTTIDAHSQSFYQDTNISDFWVAASNPSELNLWRVRNIKGVQKAEKRFTVNNATARIDGKPILRVDAVPSENTLDMSLIMSGKKLSKHGAILDRSFAQANHLSVGDPLTIEVNDKRIDTAIEALALSSENIYAVKDTASMMPDPKGYGFIVIDEDRIASAYGGRKPYNQIEVRLAQGADAAEIQSRMDSIFGKKLNFVMAQTDNRGVNFANAKVIQFQSLATVFPFMFFLVTALITFSTMMRLTEDQRNQIGILKALGYSKKSILWHYTSYGVFVGMAGILVGILFGPNVIGRLLLSKIKNLMTFPVEDMVINISKFLFGASIIMTFTAGISFLSCLKLQNEVPAELLRTKMPKKGRHIFLEHFPHVWNRMKFSQKLTARNAMRNKFRIVVSILGVSGCAGLIIGALALFDLVSGIPKTLYEKTYSYDQKVILDSDTTDRAIRNLNLDGIVQDMEESSIQLTTQEGLRKMTAVSVFSKESPLIHLEDADGNSVTLPDKGIAMTRKLAELMHVKVGDTVNLKRSSDTYYPVIIMKIVYMPSAQGIYMTDDYWLKIAENFNPTSLLVKWNKKNNDFLNSGYITSYTDRTTQKSDFEGNLSAIFGTSLLLIVSGAVLAFVVLYNMGMLNFAERVRDLATLEVLGFHQKKIRPLVLAENVFSVFAGILFGIPIGRYLANTIAGGFGDDFDLISHVTVDRILIAALVTLIFAAIVNYVVRKKIKSIDMLQALKSVE